MNLLDGYAAKRCPQRVVFDQRPPPGATPLPLAEAIELRQGEGTRFQSLVFDDLTKTVERLGHSVARLDLDSNATASDTLRAMDDGVELIVGGWLPADETGKRTGRPDLLLRTEFDERWRYRPVEVKGHRTMRPTTGGGVAVSSFAELFRRPITMDEMSGLANRRRSNGLQLAHFYRMLETIGRQSHATSVGVIGKERLVLWMDLDDGSSPAGWDSNVDTPKTLLQRYDHEFSFRLDAVAAAAIGAPIVEPVWVHDCNDCPWRAHCLPLVRDRQCVSTLQGVGYQAWRCCRRMGIDTVEQLAALDWHSAAVADEWPVDALVSLPDLLADPDATPDVLTDGPLAKLLSGHGFSQKSDLERFDRRTLERLGWPTGRLASHIDEARARTHAPGGACLRRGLDALVVPSFDREIDIDMESGLSGPAYLWGTYDAGNDTATFDADWSTNPDEAAANVFVSFWERIGVLRQLAERDEQTIGFYCWHDEAEKTALRRGAQAASKLLGKSSAPEDVEAFFETGTLIDLCALARQDLVTGGSKGLKAMAPLAGFQWRDEDPDGAASMVWHSRAIDQAQTATARSHWRQRLIEYNEDDVRAEAAVRHWMRNTAFIPVDRVGG